MNPGVIAVTALFVIGYGLISGRAERTVISAPMVFVAFGLLIGDAGFGLFSLGRESPVIHILAELTLITILFTDASRIDLKLLRREHAIPQRLLLFGLPLCILLGTVAAAVVFETLTLWEGLVLAVILAPTDAALGQAVVSRPRIPVRVRQALNVESGLNDGIALPIVLIAVFCAGLLVGNTVRDHCNCLYEFSESQGQLLSLLVFMVFGAVMVPPALEHLSGPVLLYAVLSLTLVRLIPTAIALAGMNLRPATQLFLGWFGPRGIASILFVLLVLEEAELAAGDHIFAVVVFTVLLSIVAHGVSALPATGWYAAFVEREAESAMVEKEHATEMPTRLGWHGD